MADEMSKALDWDAEIEKESNYILLDEGDYNFTITNFERSRFDGSEKIGPCPMAIVNFEVGDERAKISEKFLLSSSMEWKLSMLFKSVGLKQSGQKVKMDWNKLVGSTGRLRIKHVAGYKDPSKTYMAIDTLYEKTGRQFTPGEF